MGIKATLPSNIPACRSEFKLSIKTSFSIVENVKEASAVCRSFLEGVVIFFTMDWASQYNAMLQRLDGKNYKYSHLDIKYAINNFIKVFGFFVTGENLGYSLSMSPTSLNSLYQKKFRL